MKKFNFEMKEKLIKKIFLSISLLLMLVMTACGSTASGTQVSSTQTSDSLPVATQLVVGTLNLEGTEQAVTGEQASELLLMWQVYQTLSSSAAAQAEIDGLIEQIQETMTAEQMEAIAGMNLTQQDIFAVMQEQGVGMGQARQSSSGSSSTQSGGGFASPDGGMAGGAPADGGAPMDGGMAGMAGAEAGTGTDQGQDTEASPSVGETAGVPATLVEALIQLLEQKAGSCADGTTLAPGEEFVKTREFQNTGSCDWTD